MRAFNTNKLCVTVMCLFTMNAYAQTNSFPSDGFAGIGITEPLSPLDIRKNKTADRSHVIFGNTTNVLGETSSSLTFAGWGLMHAGFSWIPKTDSSGKLLLAFGGSESPENNTVAVTFMAGGNVGIGTLNPSDKLSVNGNIRAKEMKVEAGNWPDYVFDASYTPPSLSEIESFIRINKHLPEVPSAKEVGENGIDLGSMNGKLLKKIEELTLHLIEKEKQLNSQMAINQEQSRRLEIVEKQVSSLLSK